MQNDCIDQKHKNGKKSLYNCLSLILFFFSLQEFMVLSWFEIISPEALERNEFQLSNW